MNISQLSNTLVRRLISLVALFIVIYSVLSSLVWLVSPYVVRTLSTGVFERLGVEIADESVVRLNLFTSTLSVKGYGVLNAGERHLEVEALELRYDIWRLWHREIRIRDVLLMNAKVSVELLDGDAGIGGIFLSRLSNNESNSELRNESTVAVGEPTPVNNAFSVVVDRVSLKNIDFNIQTLSAKHHLALPWLTISDAHVSNSEFQTKVAGRFELAEGGLFFTAKITTDATKDGLVTLVSTLKLTDLDLVTLHPYLPEGFAIESGAISLDTSVAAQITSSDIQLALGASTLGINTLNIAADLQRLKLDSFQVDLASATLAQKTQPVAEPEYKVSIAQINNTGLDMSDASVAALLPKLTLDALEVNGIDVSPQGVEIADVNFYAPSVSAVLSASSNKSDEQEEAVIAQQENAEEAGSSEALFPLVVHSIRFASPGLLTFEDHQQTPPFSMALSLDVLDIKNLNTINTSVKTLFELAGHEGEYFTFALSGDVQPFVQKKSFNISGGIKEYSLPEANGYTKQFLSFGVDRGVLFSDVEMLALDNQLEGVIRFNLKGPVFTSVEEVDTLSVVDQASLPLNLALNYLKDSNGDIHLKIPVKGDLNSPDVSVRHIVNLAIRKAAMQQVESYLIKSFVPYSNVLSVVRVIGAEALKVRLNDLEFAAGQFEIEEHQHAYIDQLNTLLHDKPDLRIHACGYAAAQEGEDLTARLALADQRSAALKRALVQKGVVSERILVCASKVDKREGAKPRVELGE